jgi:hypothetical protein
MNSIWVVHVLHSNQDESNYYVDGIFNSETAADNYLKSMKGIDAYKEEWKLNKFGEFALPISGG